MAVQVALPASYYLLRDDRDDERFAWRMFSSVRLTRCTVAAFEEHSDKRLALDLRESLHASWQRSLERGRRRVIERFLATRCERQALQYSLLERRCTSPSGTALPIARYRYDCRERALEVGR